MRDNTLRPPHDSRLNEKREYRWMRRHPKSMRTKPPSAARDDEMMRTKEQTPRTYPPPRLSDDEDAPAATLG